MYYDCLAEYCWVLQLSIETLRETSFLNWYSVTEDTLIPNLEEFWQKFLCSIESSVSDYLSVEHLGIILKRLAETGKWSQFKCCRNLCVLKPRMIICIWFQFFTETFKVKRPFLPGFEKGVPNLLLCPQGDILLCWNKFLYHG